MSAAVLDAMANPSRLRTLMLICEREWTVGDLAVQIGISQSALSQHLRRLRVAKLVKVRRESQWMLYRCEDVAVLAILDVLGLRVNDSSWIGSTSASS
uniref:ArsR family transcriptional regulator n=1 Tax=Agrobacterium albertimagni TaxID=147266 RepID=A0A7C1NWM1_9HYPH